LSTTKNSLGQIETQRSGFDLERRGKETQCRMPE